MEMEKQKRTSYDNLIDQLDSVSRHTHIKSFKTRATYYDHTSLFLKFYDSKFHGQKFKNVSGMHIRAYVKEMQGQGLSPSTIKSRLSGIRFFYEQAGGKNRLPDNTELGLEKRKSGKENRAWLDSEYLGCVSRASSQGRIDVVYAAKLSRNFGLRIEEICRVRVEHIEKAFRYSELTVKGKGGQVRAVPVETAEQRKLLVELYNYAKKNRLGQMEYVISSTEKYGVQRKMKSLENWLYANRAEFTLKNRKALTKDGEKPRKETITWHGLRHRYAQDEFRRMKDGMVKDPKRKTSETLGHHRPDITNVYLAEKPNGHK